MRQAVWYSAMTVLLAFIMVVGWMGMVLWNTEPEPAEVPAPGSMTQREVVPADRQTVLRLQTDTGVVELDLQTYLLGVLCCEMPLSFEPAALQAQTVASRTYTLYHLDNGKHPDADLCASASCCQAWKSESELAAAFGDDWESWREKAMDAITVTDGQVLTQNGELINAVFFACSGGMTEPAAAVWGGEVSYLQAVPSPGEEIAASYTGETSVSLSAFKQILTQENSAVDLTGNPTGWFGTVTYSAGGGVAQMQIGGVSYDGTRLRSLFGLNSTWFTVAVGPDEIVFRTRGKGHRVGMSQYGAQAMALEGCSCEEILTHYYTDVMLTDYMES